MPDITGIGLVTCLGADAPTTWRRLLAGESGLASPRAIDLSGYPYPLAGEAPVDGVPDLRIDNRARALALMRRAIDEALAQAGVAAPLGDRWGLAVGSSLAACASSAAFWDRYVADGPAAADYAALQSYDVEPWLTAICEALGLRGPAVVAANACAAGVSAISLATDWIASGEVDGVLACGADPLDPHTLAGFGVIGALTRASVRPLAADRDGMALADGFAALVVEADGGARALGHVLGVGESSDAYHRTQPDPAGGGAALAMRRALADAALPAETVGSVNLHATATPANDGAEVAALRAVFGDGLATLPLVASKPALGHTLGAAGTVEAAIALLGLRDGVLPPQATPPAPDASLGRVDLVTERRPCERGVAMSNSFGFGGCNASVLLGREMASPGLRGRRRAGAPVVISGVGLVSPLGVGALTDAGGGRPDVPDGVPAPREAIAFVPEFDAEAHANRKHLRKIGELARLTTVAAHLALADWEADEAARAATAVVVGTCLGCSSYHLEYHEALERRGLGAASALLFAESVYNAASTHLARIHGLRGPNWALVGGEDVALAAVVAAAHKLAQGQIDAALAGGADQWDARTHASLHAQGLVGPPGPPMGEGAARLLLEPAETARLPARARWLGHGRARGDDGTAALARLGCAPADVDVALATTTAAEAALVGAPRVEALAGRLGNGFAGTTAIGLAQAVAAIEAGADRALVLAVTPCGSATAVLLGGCG